MFATNQDHHTDLDKIKLMTCRSCLKIDRTSSHAQNVPATGTSQDCGTDPLTDVFLQNNTK
jgi:hypothetical protein